MKTTKNKCYNYEDVVVAFVDALDGCHSWGDIKYNTGLPEKRCKEIEKIWLAAQQGRLEEEIDPKTSF